MNTEVAGRLRSARTHRLIRQLHLWIGAWGAIAAILFGISGFMQNHRGVMKLPQGDSTEISKVELEVPEASRGSRDVMRDWLRDTQHIEVEIQRAPPKRGGGEGDRGKSRWNFAGGNARIQTQVEYVEGASSLTVRKTEKSPLAILESLHKGVGGGIAWILLGDSFAVAMVALGLSGLIMWARGRSLREMTFSIVGVAVVVLLVVGGSAIL
ncbi:MAG: uncharacterized protein QOI59_3275 [Gammaproteobacteria bacterium]|nr:uncharacterized protein [Gammaproteobacteria bacterium]